MSRIRILPVETANRIAAGEVIERPASVVKELVENSIDAEATKIVVKIEGGGRRLIQVSDDGHGMDGDDALLALEAHATSKIQEVFDIDRINTLGFRGEALPSIAGVSRFRLQTRTRDSTAGHEVVVDSSVIREVRECGCPIGTAITVRNLFYNLPARRKFMRTAATEQGHIQEMILLQALAHPAIGFELFFDGQAGLRVPPGCDLETRLYLLLGRKTGQNMLKVEYKEQEITVYGFVARPGMTRSSRREQRFFVNGRPAVADIAFFAIRDAYHTLVMKGRYPPVVLYLELPPEQVDVNVHPTKREIRFRDGRLVGRIMAAAVRRALRELTPDMVPRRWPPAPSLSRPDPVWPDREDDCPDGQTEGSSAAIPESPDPGLDSRSGRRIEQPLSEFSEPITFQDTLSDDDNQSDLTSPSLASRDLLESLRIVGTMHKLYLLAESVEGLVLIDHHAAHERILYEKLLRQAENREIAAQPLLIPVNLDFPPADAALLGKNLEAFARLGFQIEPFGGGSFLIAAVPSHLPGENIEGLMRDLFEELRISGISVANSSISNG